MYRGLPISTAGIAPFIGIKLASFDILMDRFGPEKGNPKTIYYNLLIGAMAGTIAVTFTYPIDLTRRLMQLNGTPGHNYENFSDLCK